MSLMDRSPACINMYYIDHISIKLHYTSPALMGQLLNECLCDRVIGFTFKMKLMEQNIVVVV